MNKTKLLLLGSMFGVAFLAGAALHLTFRPANVTPPSAVPVGSSHERVRDVSPQPLSESGSHESGKSESELTRGLGWGAASLTGRTEAQSVGATVPEVPVVDATWIRYVGVITGADGTSWHYFKDGRSGRIIRGSTDPGPDQIHLSPTADRYILEVGAIRLGVRIHR